MHSDETGLLISAKAEPLPAPKRASPIVTIPPATLHTGARMKCRLLPVSQLCDASVANSLAGADHSRSQCTALLGALDDLANDPSVPSRLAQSAAAVIAGSALTLAVVRR